MPINAFMDKYLICRPEGGLTDMLSQLGQCFNYCLRYGRVLVIDTENTITFASPFLDYFSIEHPSLKVITESREFIKTAIARGLAVHPPHARLNPTGGEQPGYVRNLNFCLAGTPLTFDFDINHDADVLLHQQCGRTAFDFEFLSCLRLSPRLRGLVERRWASLPKPYIGIHVRNTDIKSDPSKLMPVVRRYPGGVFLATDTVTVQRSVRRAGNRRVFISRIPDFKGKALHRKKASSRMKFRLNTLAIVDMVLLALSKRVYLATEASGYSLLARELNCNRAVLLAWLGGALEPGSCSRWSQPYLAIGRLRARLPHCEAWQWVSKLGKGDVLLRRQQPSDASPTIPNVRRQEPFKNAVFL